MTIVKLATALIVGAGFGFGIAHAAAVAPWSSAPIGAQDTDLASEGVEIRAPRGVLYPELDWSGNTATIPLGVDREISENGRHHVRLEYESPHDGWLVVSAFGDASGSWIRVLSLDGESVAEDHPVAPVPYACVELAVAQGEPFEVLIGGSDNDHESLRLRVAELEIQRSPLQALREQVEEAQSALARGAPAARTSIDRACELVPPCSDAFPPGHVELQHALANLGVTLYRSGLPERALPLQESVLAHAEVFFRDHPNDPQLQWTRGNLAATLAALGELQRARELETAVLLSFERLYGDRPDHPDLYRARRNHAGTLLELGELKEARQQLLELRTSAERTYHDRPDHPELRFVRSKLAFTLSQLGDLDEAKALLVLVAESAERAFAAEPDHGEIRNARRLLAVILSQLGDLDGALSLQQWCLASAERAHADQPDHPELQELRSTLGTTLVQLGELERARTLQEAAVASADRWFAQKPDDPYRLSARANLAVTLGELGELDRTRELEQSVLEGRLRLHAEQPDHPDLQGARGNLAGTLRHLGELERARELHELALDAFERFYADHPDHPAIQRARGNLAATLGELGELEHARALDEAVLGSAERFYRDEPDHPQLQQARIALAGTLAELGELDRARELGAAVLENRTRFFRDQPDAPGLQYARVTLAATLWKLGEFDRARALQEAVTASRERVFAHSPDHPELQLARKNLAAMLVEFGEIEQAHALREAVFASAERLYASRPHHQTLLQARADLAESYVHAGDLERARKLTLSFVNGAKQGFERREGFSPRQWEVDVQARLPFVSRALSFVRAFPDPTLESAVFACVESARCVSSSRARLRALAELQPEEETREQELRRRISVKSERLRRELEDPARYDTRGEQFARLVAELRRAERDHAELLHTAAARSGIAWSVEAPAIARSLSDQQAAIGFWRYWRRDWEPDSGRFGEGDWAYCAWVLRRGANPVRVDLCDETSLTATLERWRQLVLRGSDREVRPRDPSGEPLAAQLLEAAEALRVLVFDPLSDSLHDVDSLTLAVDGQLHFVPFDSLPWKDGTTSNRWRFERRNTLKELTGTRDPRLREPSLLVLGGIDYSSPPESAPSSIPSSPTAPPVGPPIGSVLQFPRLSSSQGESLDVAGLFEERFDRSPLHHFTRSEASRHILCDRAGEVRFLHLATHGYFLPESFRSLVDDPPLSLAFPGVQPADRNTRVRGLLPMALCGLALAGANLPPGDDGIRAGIVTAEELSHLDLSGCELVVLSACDTHVGLVRASQGVASLQQALYAAGAHATITTLWRVRDDATRELMKRFYENWWLRGMSKGNALRAARQWMREARDSATGEALYGTKEWAAWVLVGDGS